jgi:CRP-like cAMP-binding protein
VTETEQSPEDLLAKVPLFSQLDRKGLRKLAALCVPRQFEPNTEIITEGGTGLGLFIITDGQVEITKGEGDSRVRLAVLENGDLLGEMALIDDQPRSASATALVPTSCLLVTRGSFQTLVKKDPEIAWCIVPTLADRIRELQQRMMETDTEWTETDDRDAENGPEVQPAKGESDTKDKDDGRSLDDIATALVRGQYALTIAGFAGIRGVARAFEKFLRTLASETELDESERFADVARRLPEGLIEATGAGLREAEKMPEQLLEKYRRYRDTEGSS